jgi:hypothetical protein
MLKESLLLVFRRKTPPEGEAQSKQAKITRKGNRIEIVV